MWDEGVAPGDWRQQGHFVAVMQDRFALGEFLIYGDVEGPISKLREAFVEEIANCRISGQGDAFVLEAGGLAKAGEKDQADVHAVSSLATGLEADRCQSPDLPPRFSSSWTLPITMVFSSAFAIS